MGRKGERQLKKQRFPETCSKRPRTELRVLHSGTAAEVFKVAHNAVVIAAPGFSQIEFSCVLFKWFENFSVCVCV